MVSCHYPSTGCQADRWHLPSPTHHFSSEDNSSKHLKSAQIPTPKNQIQGSNPKTTKNEKKKRKKHNPGEKIKPPQLDSWYSFTAESTKTLASQEPSTTGFELQYSGSLPEHFNQ